MSSYQEDDEEDQMRQDMARLRSRRCSKQSLFREFCASTSLHGWHHLNMVSSQGKLVWLLIVFASLGVASVFIVTAAKDFVDRTVVTTIETTTAPLQDVHFPSVIICNINQVKKSFFRGLNLTEGSEEIDLLLGQFFTGSDKNISSEEEEIIMKVATSEFMVRRLEKHSNLFSYYNSTKHYEQNPILTDWKEFLANNSDFIKSLDFLKDMAVEEPGDGPILRARFGDHEMSEGDTDFLPFFGTDQGLCSLIKPQLMFNSSFDHLSFSDKMFGPHDQPSYSNTIRPGVKVGKENGLSLLLDAETFDYSTSQEASEGFKVSIQHHLDQPLMSINEIDISPGFETHLAVTPTLFKCTQQALERFTPQARGCYSDDEILLKYLPKNLYRYDIYNCLFEAAYEEVLSRCQCTPYFHWAGMSDYPNFCKGQSLLCMNRVLSKIGEYEYIADTKNANKKIKCLATCNDQQNSVSVSFSHLPNSNTFKNRPEFCLVVKKLAKTCKLDRKRLEINTVYPDLCSSLDEMDRHLNENNSNSSELDDLCSYLRRSLTREGVLMKLILQYVNENLSLLNIYIKKPVVTRILRDERIPIIWFVANCGGILGLCMGFSIVTVFEVIHYLCKTLIEIIKSKLFTHKENVNMDKELSDLDLNEGDENCKSLSVRYKL